MASYSKEEKNEIVTEVCTLIASGKSMRDAIKEVGKASRQSVFDWINEDKKKLDQYARAMEYRADCIFDDIIDIADNTEGDMMMDENGREKVNHENIQRSRLKVDTRKWIISKMMPSRYGEKLDITTEDKTPLTPEERKARILELSGKASQLKLDETKD